MIPASYEKFWLKIAKSALKLPANADDAETLEKIRPAVSELSDLFTIYRPDNFRDYMSDTRLLAAYGLFFFPQSFARAQFAINRIFDFCEHVPTFETGKPLRILDLGSGAAPCGLAVAEELHARIPEAQIELTAVDRSRAALDSVPANFRWLKINSQATDLKNFAGTQTIFDIIILGWSLNEIIPANAEKSVESAIVFIKKLSSSLTQNGTLIILEPALKETAERLQNVSDYFARAPGLPFYRIAPELGNHECPLLAEGMSWNHEVRRWTPPATMEFLNRKLFREIQVVKFAWTALSKTQTKPIENSKNLIRLISPMEIKKAYLRFYAISADGEKISVEIPTRGLSKNECKKISAEWERGDIADTEGKLEKLSLPGQFRLSKTPIRLA